MDFFNTSFWQGFFGNLLATIIGVAVGIPVAFWINRRVEASTEQEKKKKILTTLLVELTQIGLAITELKSKTKINERVVPLAFTMSEETWRAFSDGGELQWIRNPSLLMQLASTYSKITTMKMASEKYMDAVIQKRNVDQSLIESLEDNLRQNLRDLESSIVLSLDKVRESLESEK